MSDGPPAGAETMKRTPDAAAFAAVMLTTLMWSSAFVLIRIAARHIGPLPLASARFTLASLLVGLWLISRRVPLPAPRDVPRLLGCALLGIAIYNSLLNGGERTVSAGAASFIASTVPIFTAILAGTLHSQKLSKQEWAASLVSFAGVALIAANQQGGLSFGTGSSLVIASAACQAVYFNLQRPLVERYGALASTAYTFVVAAVLLSPWLPSALTSLSLPNQNPELFWALAGLAIFPSVLGYSTWAFAVARIGPARAANFLFVVPVLSTLLAIPLAGENPNGLTLFGGAVVIGGVVLFKLSINRARS